MGRSRRGDRRIHGGIGEAVKLDWLDADLRASIDAMTEAQRVALILAGEARSEPIEGIVGVANVIRNRVTTDLGHDGKPDWWGEGFSDVVTRPWQFSCLSVKGGKGNFQFVKGLAKQFAEKAPITDQKIKQCILVAHGVIDGYLVDNVSGSNHYCVYTLQPAWSKGQQIVARKGSHHFFKL
jgi:N-acetylmuramoyl-L-alanine amidase